MNKNKIIIYRYHKDVEYCKIHLDHLKKLNPDYEIHGIFGGKKEEFNYFTENLAQLSSNYLIDNVPDEWKWKNFDFILSKWFIEKGKEINFNRLYVYEWDLFFAASIDELYGQLPNNAVVVSGLIKLNKIKDFWYWSSDAKRITEYHDFFNYMEKEYSYNKEPYACLCPGFSVSKDFLIEMEKIKLPDLLNDEARLPVYCQILGFQLYNSSFLNKWFALRDYFTFNCTNNQIKIKTIFKELKRSNGKRAFHPFRNFKDTNFYEFIMTHEYNTTNLIPCSIQESRITNAIFLYKMYRMLKKLIGK